MSQPQEVTCVQCGARTIIYDVLALKDWVNGDEGPVCAACQGKGGPEEDTFANQLEELTEALPDVAKDGIATWDATLDEAKLTARVIGTVACYLGEDEGTPFIRRVDAIIKEVDQRLAAAMEEINPHLAAAMYKVHKEGEQS